jgi:hypothetical protein
MEGYGRSYLYESGLMLRAYQPVDCPVQSTIQQKTLDFVKGQTKLFDNIDKLSLWNKMDTVAYVRAVPELVEWTNSLNLKLREVNITVCNSNKDVGLHIDELPVTAKINFPILNTEDTYNCWYRVPEELLATVQPITNIFGNSYYNLETIDLGQCELVGEYELLKPVVFNSQIPHMIRMQSAKKFPRLVLSCTFFKEPIQSLL